MAVVPMPASGVPTCPACHAPVTPGSRFCNQCGAPLSAVVLPPSAAHAPPPPPTPPAPPVDLRRKVDDDRGVLKRLQLMIPGYRGYRQGEDIRAADSLLRLQVADRVHRAVSTVQDCRARLTQAGQFQGLADLAPVLSDLQQLEGEIRNAEQGYTGISPAVTINPQQLDSLYQYDYGFVTAADQLSQTLAPLESAASGGDAGAISSAIQATRGQVRQLDTAFKSRIRAVEGIQV